LLRQRSVLRVTNGSRDRPVTGANVSNP
jgi:hypothetical protein